MDTDLVTDRLYLFEWTLDQKKGFNYDKQLVFFDAPLEITSVKSEMEIWGLLDV